jgi:hypothetical protein
MLQAIDYRTGAIAWSHRWAGSSSVRSGLLSTAGNVLFAGDAQANFVAFDAARGVPLWHSRLHTSITNGPITYELDGIQYVVVGAGDSLYAFGLQKAPGLRPQASGLSEPGRRPQVPVLSESGLGSSGLGPESRAHTSGIWRVSPPFALRVPNSGATSP